MIELAQRTLPQPDAPGEHPLSEGQRALWVLDRLDPAAAACHLAGAARIRDGLDAAAVGRALEQLVHRHPALRTTFETRDGTPVRRVHAWLAPDFIATDLDDPGQLSEVLVAEAWRPFHLEQGPLWRVRVVRLPAGGAVLLLAIHHLIADFASVSLLLRDLLERYREERGGEPARLVAPGPGMTEWIARQEARLDGPGGASLRDFWLRRLGGDLPVVELPVDHPRPLAPTWRGIAVTGRLEGGAEALRAIGRSRGATLFAAVAAGLQAVLHRWTGEDEVLVGVPAARRGPGFAAEVGYFVNPVVLRLGLPGGEPGFADLVEAAGGSVREALAHGGWPFQRLARDLFYRNGGEADAGRSLLRVLAVLQPARTAEERALAPFALGEPGARATLLGLELESIALPEERVQNDLLLMAAETEDGGLALSLRLDADLFDPATAGRLLGHLKTFLGTAMAEPGLPAVAIDLLSPAERLQLEAWSAGLSAPTPGPCLHELIAEQAARTPEATALVHGKDEVTYRELRQRASELADRLRGLGVGPEVRVGVCAGRTPELVVGLLSVLESGGAYVPLDPVWPTERLAFLLEDSGAALVMTDGPSAGRLPETALPRVRLDGWEGNRTRAFPPWRISSRNLAYLIYTSGSTGRPKAVAIEHRSAVTLALWARSVFSDRELDGVLASTSIGFDLSVFELLVPLCHGGRVILAGSVLDLPDLPPSAGVRLINTVPSALAELLAAGALPASVETVNLAGEPLRRELVRGLFDTGVRRVLNLYGPSEDTTYSTWSELALDNVAEPSIGRPIAGTQARVLDARLWLVPPGVAGELFLGGAGLARGYLGRPELTADRFIPSPFAEDGPGARLYRTGDRARFRPDGELEFLGRLDDQVKIRGFRIEPGEVEAVLEMHPEVGQAVVLALGNGGERRLVAYVVPARPLTPWPPLPPSRQDRGNLRSFLATRLPDHLIPSAFVFLEAFPRTPNGKVDRKALAVLGASSAAPAVYVAPRTPLEAEVAAVWAEVLERERVGVHDDFFDLGGHSLLAVRVQARLGRRLGVDLPLSLLLRVRTVAGLAVTLAAGLPPVEPIKSVPRKDPLPLSFGQQRLWFLHRMDPLSAAYNMAGAWRLSGLLDLATFAQALGGIVRRHEVLRTTYAAVGEEPVQVIHPAAPFVLPVVDLAGLPAGAGEPEARRLAFEEADRPFDLARGPVLRASVVRLAQREHLALLTVHHIACDGWSVGLLLRELERPSTNPLPLQYADFAAWQRRWLDGPALQAQLGYWRQRLADAPAVLELPTDRPRPAVRSQRGARHPVTVSASTVARLNGLARSEGMTLYAVLLALFQALLGRLTGEDDLVVGTPVAGRRQVEVENLIGFFVNTLALRADLRGDPPLRVHLEETLREVLDAFSHQDLPFERLVEELRPERSLSHTPIFQVLFALQNAPGGPLRLPGLRVEPLPPAPRAPFDLELDLAEQDGALVGSLGFAVDLFDEATAGRMVGHWVAWLEGAVERERVGGRISELPVLREVEVAEIVRLSRRLRRDPHPLAPSPTRTHTRPGEGELLELFEAQVARTPDAEAVLSAGVSLTYAELERRANRLARHLATLGAGPGEIVAVQLERSPDLAVALLGVLSAGAAYLPLDPSLPAERAAFLMRDSGARLLLDAGMLRGGEEGVLPQPPRPGDLAYVIYTSGTTGAPKGVMVEHGSLLATIRALLATFRFEPGERMPSIAPYSFDIFLFELLGPLLTGGSVSLLPLSPGLDLDALLEELESAARFHAVPAVLRQVVDRVMAHGISARYAGVREIYTGGDLVPPELLGDARRAFPSARISVLYGPTEGTIICAAQVDAQASSRPLLGQPLPGAVLELRDRFGNLVPLGVTGEIYLGGPGVARGYLGKPELTAERFVPGPDGSRSYRTGDLARRLPDGTLEFLGRADRQVKIRGIRIEPGEIESRLAEHPGVREAVVVVQESMGERGLAAFFVPAGEAPSPSELRAYLARFLPAAMLPGVFVALDELPLTPNAKIDRNALAAWSIVAEAEESTAPRTPEEEIVAGLWAELLGVERVGVREDVFERGAHSLLVTRMASRLRETFGIELPLRALFEEPTPAGLARRIAEARTAAPGLPLRSIPRTGELPLSFAQQRLWFVDQMEPGNPLYSLAALLRLHGQLDVVALERAFTEVVRRHEVLRTTFPATRGRPRQEVAPPSPFRLPIVDLAGLEHREEEARRQGLAEARRPFDLTAGPLLRGFLLRLDPLEHLLVLNVHHIVSDGWSTGILVKEVGALYGGSASLPELPVQYADFAVWQREQLAGEVLETQLAWWRRRLADAPPVLELPTDRPRPPVRGVRGADVPVRLSAELSEALARLGRQEGATLFMTLLAAFQALLHRDTGESDLSVGTPIAGRGRIETEGLIGFFVNTLVMRTNAGGSPSFRGLIARVREAALEAYAHQDLPFERLVEELVPQRDPARTPLFQVFFALDDQALDATGLPGLEMAPVRIPSETAKFDLSLALTREPAGLSGSIEYSTDLFDRTTVQRLARRFQRLVRAAVERPEELIDSLPLLAEEERHQVAVEWADTRSAYPRESCIHELFEEQAARTPDLPAVSRGGGDGARLTYAELNDRANGLARHLATCGVVPDSLVAVLQERSPDLVVTLLAILKAGGAYVPLDPAWPVDRLGFMLRDSGARILIADAVPEGLDIGPEVRILNVQREPGGIGANFAHLGKQAPEGRPMVARDGNPGWQRPTASFPPGVPTPGYRESPLRGSKLAPIGPAEADGFAYVLYTSGSTGRPKAVGVPHRAVVRLVRGQSYARRIGPGDRLTQFSTASFDGATFEIWSALLSGAELVVVPPHRTSLEELGDLVEREAITTLLIPASLFHQMVDGPLHKLASLRQLLTGAEVVSAAHVRRFLEALPGRRVVNGYGPTENTVFTCCHPVDAAEQVRAPLPIGRPIANTRVYLLDGERRPVPLGVAGELFTGGDGLARGYLGRPDLTAERFVPDPFGEPGSRLYRTGDRVRWLADGTVEFLGRLDAQVKLRGFRVEPGEVEAAVAASPGVERAVVLARQEPTGLRLVAYVVPVSGAGHDTAAVRAHLRGRLPEHMVPSAFVWLDALPLTENGKVDRRALARMAAPAETGTRASAAPRTPIEEGLAGIWRDVLGVAAAGPDDDFFELGGHSLLATQVVSRVREAFSVELPLRDLFATPRLGDLAGHIEEEHRRGAGLTTPPVVPMPREGGLPLSFGQEWMWIADQLDPEAAAYNASIPVRLRGPLDSGALAAALREVARRHEILHTRFVVDASGPVQVPDSSLILPFALADLGGLPAGQRESEANRLAASEAARPFDLAAGPPARALLVHLGSEDHLLLLSLHHLATDGWSAGVLLREVAALLAGLPLPELPVQYGDFAVWQRQWLSGETLETLLSWWREHLAGPLPVLELPADRPGTAVGGLGERLPFRLDPGPTEALRAMARGRGSTLFAVLLAAFKTLLARIARQDDLVVGTPVANRTRRELEGLIGYFVNDLPLRTRIGGDPTFLELLDRVHETALGAWAHQDLPLRRLVQELGATAPLFRAWFQLQNTPLPSVELPGVKLALHDLEALAATFDLELLTREVDAGLAGHLVYNRELFRRDTAAALLRSFLVLIEGIAAEPGRRLSELPLLAPEERHALLYEHNPSGLSVGATTLHAAFEAVAAARPEAPAVTCEGVSLTYRELSQRADALARRLRRLGVGPESRVGLRLERSLELVIGILGVLKAGGAYVPLDPDYPRERLELLLEDARVHALVTWGESGFSVSDFGLGSSVDGEAGPDHLAYVIYTSGSTGRPKGVMVTHRQAARLFEATRWFGFGPEDVWTLFHSYAFDFSVWELWGALLHGGRLVVVPRWVSRSPEAFLDLLVEEKVTVLNQTPSAFYQLMRAEEAREGAPLSRTAGGDGRGDGGEGLRWVIFGGEALEPPKLLPWFDRHGDARPALVNMYGITETTVHVTLRPLTRADADSPDSVLGRPLDDLRLYLLDPAFGPVPAGAVGEIFVGGGGVARGYLGRPDLTAERFVPDPFSGDPGARLYRSGDLARRRPDGDELAYQGRADQQLKVRGFRIEPGEIEAALVRHPAIAQAAVIVRKLSAEDVRLVACFVPRAESPSASDLREHLLAMLPEPWVPGLFVPVPALPLTANGKVDRRALAEMVDAATAASSVEAGDEPLTPLEEMLAALWADLLEVDHVGRDDNFFALGGHSLLMTRIAARVREAFGVAPPMRSFFERPTVAHLAVGVLGEVAGRLGAGRVEEMVAYVQGLPEAEVGRLVARKKDLTPWPPLPSHTQPPGEGEPPTLSRSASLGGGAPSPGGWVCDGRGGRGVRSLRVRDLLAPPGPPPRPPPPPPPPPGAPPPRPTPRCASRPSPSRPSTDPKSWSAAWPATPRRPASTAAPSALPSSTIRATLPSATTTAAGSRACGGVLVWRSSMRGRRRSDALPPISWRKASTRRLSPRLSPIRKTSGFRSAPTAMPCCSRLLVKGC
jgi:amino acid adenylation domain-containing protein